MSKTGPSFNSPVDNVLAAAYMPTLAPLRAIGVTPNWVTTMSLASAIGSAKMIRDNRPAHAAALYALNYVFDCMDGAMARTYDMETDFGDWYDHVTDWVSNVLIMAMLLMNSRYDGGTTRVILATTGALIIAMTAWYGCQEKAYDSDVANRSMSGTRSLCVGDPHTTMKRLRWVGCGTYATWVTMVLFLNRSVEA